MLNDRFGRTIDNLRVSITDRCNFRCTYCMPEAGLAWLPREEVLSYEEIVRFVRIVAGLGVRKIRLTGGEPLVRRDLSNLVDQIASLEGIDDLALTTNGMLLTEQAPGLAKAGLGRINISLDGLDEPTFQRLARRGSLERVLSGIATACDLLPGRVKVNAVILRGVNDHQIVEFARLARERACGVRFIEFMPLDADQRWQRDMLVSGEEIRTTIATEFPLEVDPNCPPESPSRDYTFADGVAGKVGFIDSVTAPFCESCNRMRLTADGRLRTCLFSVEETDIASLLRGGASDDDIAAAVTTAVSNKERGHAIGAVGFTPASRSMSQIGG